MISNRIRHGAQRALAAAAIGLTSFGACAGVTLFHADPAAYAAGLGTAGLGGSVVTGDLTSAAAAHGVTTSVPYSVGDPGAIAVGGASFMGNAPGNAAGFLIDTSYRISGAFYSHQVFNGADNSLTVQFSAPVQAFSFTSNVLNFTISGPAGEVPITLTTSNGDVVTTTTTPYYFGGDVSPPAPAPLVYNGLLSSVPFTSLTIATTAQALNITGFDNASAAAVPEQSTPVLLLAGLAVLGFLTTRRSSHAR